MKAQPFDATKELQAMQQMRKVRRQKKYCTSRLQKYRAEIIELLKKDASYRLIAEWLKFKKHMTVNHTTIMRFAKKLPEFQETNHAKLP